jgi:queuine tRNA-ribosyltransferase
MTHDGTSSPPDARPGRFVVDATDGPARASRFVTAHGEVELPAFFPVATRAAVKMLSMEQTRAQGATGLLMNTFHLHLRPGEDTVASFGGLHRFSGWDGPIITDSGGFQVFSLRDLRKVTDDGVVFASPIDGSTHEFTPEVVVEIQRKLGSDVIVSLDECVQYPAPPETVKAAQVRTIEWNARSAAAWRRGETDRQLLFGVIQGGMVRELRLECVARLAELDLPGYAVGGVSVGEGPALAREVLSYTLSAMPGDRPRYVMGVGPPEDLLDYVAMGADLFDCVLPTRNARGACAFTSAGKLRLRNAAHVRSDLPIEEDCDCECCRTASRGYLRHLYNVGEAAAPALVSIHNIHFFTRTMREARAAICAGRFEEYRRSFQESCARGDGSAPEGQ